MKQKRNYNGREDRRNSSDRLFVSGVQRSGQRDFAAAGSGCRDGGLFLFSMR